MDLKERAAQLARDRRPFVHATVVRAQPPTSSHSGDEAILLQDGTIEGSSAVSARRIRCARPPWGRWRPTRACCCGSFPTGRCNSRRLRARPSW